MIIIISKSEDPSLSMDIGFPWELSHGMGQHALHFPNGTYGTAIYINITELSLSETVDEQETEYAQWLGIYECQNDNELWNLLNFKVNKVNKFCRFVSLFVRVVL